MNENKENLSIKNEKLAELLKIQARAESNKTEVETVVSAFKVEAKVPEGTTIAVTTNATLEKNQPSKYKINDRVKLTYQLILPDATEKENVEIIATYWRSNSQNSRYYKILTELLQKDARKGFHLNDLIGVTCEVDVVHNHVENGTYANISSVKRIEVNPDGPITF